MCIRDRWYQRRVHGSFQAYKEFKAIYYGYTSYDSVDYRDDVESGPRMPPNYGATGYTQRTWSRGNSSTFGGRGVTIGSADYRQVHNEDRRPSRYEKNDVCLLPPYYWLTDDAILSSFCILNLQS
eukprot:TRINITY_DN7674_c0_g1_i16.p1 TRINITY_DN7674_c0_g1~~TRINITY_DN7674_c0_g1_i16.p1  ORF type:complete len:125 (-),score=10.95 TRINITY_DN7674_c0_g1_i16:193-567(-)